MIPQIPKDQSDNIKNLSQSREPNSCSNNQEFV